MPKENRTIFDLDDEEYDQYQNDDSDNPTWQQITDNTNEDALNMMFPDGTDDD